MVALDRVEGREGRRESVTSLATRVLNKFFLDEV